MVHNYSLKKLQTAIEPTQTLSLPTAHAKLAPTGNASVVILHCTAQRQHIGCREHCQISRNLVIYLSLCTWDCALCLKSVR